MTSAVAATAVAQSPDVALPSVADSGTSAPPSDGGSSSDARGAAGPGELSADSLALLAAISERLRSGVSPESLRLAIEPTPAPAPSAQFHDRPHAPLDPDTGLEGVFLNPDVRLSGYSQIDFLANQSSLDELDPSTGASLNQNRFEVRRVRLRAAVERTYLAGALELDGNTVSGPTARIIDAEATLQLPGPQKFGTPLAAATLGMFKTPFGFEVLQADTSRLFLERSTTERALFPGEYDLGVRLAGGWRFLRYAVGYLNGEPAGETTGFPGQDPNNAKDLVGRIGIDTSPVEGARIAAGFSFLSGTGLHKGTPATKTTVVFSDPSGDGSVNTGVSQGHPATPSIDFDRSALGGDLELSYRWPVLGNTTLYGELYSAKNLDRGIAPADPVGANRDLRELGWYVALTQQVTQFAAIGVRYDTYNPDKDATLNLVGIVAPVDQSFSTWALSAAFTTPYGRFIVEGDLNNNHLGRDVTGAPANLASNQFGLRGEVKF